MTINWPQVKEILLAQRPHVRMYWNTGLRTLPGCS